MRIYIFIFLALTVLSCAPSRFIEPLSKNQQALSFNIEGSLIDYGGTTIPIPLTSLTYAYGLSNNLTAFGSLHNVFDFQQPSNGSRCLVTNKGSRQFQKAVSACIKDSQTSLFS